MFRNLVLDTSVLIRHWQHSHGRSPEGRSENDAIRWAEALIALHATDAIVTPVAIEFLAGARTSGELRLARAFLSRLRILDQGDIAAQDWEEARKLAERVPRDGKPRHLGDCLIHAIARRRKYTVRTFDARFRR